MERLRALHFTLRVPGMMDALCGCGSGHEETARPMLVHHAWEVRSI